MLSYCSCKIRTTKGTNQNCSFLLKPVCNLCKINQSLRIIVNVC